MKTCISMLYGALLCLVIVSTFSINTFAEGQIFKEELERITPIAVEGVYDAEATVQVGTPEEQINKFKITIIQSSRTGALNLSVASGKTQTMLFFASQVLYQRERDANVVEIESFGVDFRGVRQNLLFKVNLDNMTITGEVKGNFLASTDSIILMGKKSESIIEQMETYGARSCGDMQEYVGTFDGVFFGQGRSAKLHIHQVKGSNGELTLTANITSRTRVLFHDGYFSQNNGLMTFVNDIAYPMTGRAKKLILLCDQTDTQLILTGVHIASNGQILRDIFFTKSKLPARN